MTNEKKNTTGKTSKKVDTWEELQKLCQEYLDAEEQWKELKPRVRVYNTYGCPYLSTERKYPKDISRTLGEALERRMEEIKKQVGDVEIERYRELHSLSARLERLEKRRLPNIFRIFG